jgi:hypothetical protein
MIKLLKKAISKIKRKRILKDIKKAKKVYELRLSDYMCLSFNVANPKYYKKPIDSVIPEFNKETLNAKYKGLNKSVWWDVYDRESRIKAFDKLIEIYSK